MYAPPLQSSASAPHIPQSLYQQSRIPEQPQFFLHDHTAPMTPPVVPQRRTWSQQPTPPPQEIYQPELRTWNKMGGTGGGFVLHDTPTDRYDNTKYQSEYRYIDNSKYQNGSDDHNLHHSNSFTLSQQHHQQQQAYGTSHSTPSASPQHRHIHRQISQLMDESKRSTPVSLQQIDRDSPIRKTSSVTHAPIPAPSADDMEPQNISFIGNSDDQLSEGLSRINITSGSRTYRIPSPTRPLITRNSFQPSPTPEKEPPLAEISSLDKDPTSQKGFYIQFDNDQPKRPKPPLRMKRGSPKKERSYVEEEEVRADKKRQLERELDEDRMKKEEEDRRRQMLIEQERERIRAKREASQESQRVAAASAIIIENDKGKADPVRNLFITVFKKHVKNLNQIKKYLYNYH